MSGKKPPKGPKPPAPETPFRVVRHTEKFSAKPSAEQIRQLYMASPHIEWTPFAKAHGWHPIDSRSKIPVVDWIKEKRDIIARQQAETIAEQVFNHRSRWHSDVLKTLEEYPAAIDSMFGLLKVRLNDNIVMINEDNRRAVLAAQTGQPYERQFSKVKTSDLVALTMALKMCNEAKHKALMIHDWSFKVAESFSDPKQFGTHEEKVANMEWKVNIIGGENLTQSQMGEFLGRYYDRPNMPHSPAEIDKASGGGD